MTFPQVDEKIDLGHFPGTEKREQEDFSALSSPVTSPRKAQNTAIAGLDFHKLQEHQKNGGQSKHLSPMKTPKFKAVSTATSP